MLCTVMSKKASTDLGRSLIKERRRGRSQGGAGDGWLHTSELPDGYEWSRLNLTSVTEESSLDQFLRTAELAGTEFTAEKLNVSMILDGQAYTGLPGEKETLEIRQIQNINKQDLHIPRRPNWDETTTPEELEMKERDSFLEWRRNLARLQEKEKITMTPFERNLEFWRQLWRVIERSDVVVQIVDARNPLLFRCQDLEKYIKEVDVNKVTMILMCKSDLLTPEQRAAWMNYFLHQDSIEAVAFWSSLESKITTGDDNSKLTSPPEQIIADDIPNEVKEDIVSSITLPNDRFNDSNEETKNDNLIAQSSDTSVAIVTTIQESSEDDTVGDDNDLVCSGLEESETEMTKVEVRLKSDHEEVSDADLLYMSRLLTREELLDLFRNLSSKQNGPATIGLVGYPNVGKSSTINSLLQNKKVPVSATPGRTKHFQTLYVTDDLILCDCPGLVFPNFVNTKADMICNGILSIDQMKDHVPPVSMVCRCIPRPILESTYGIKISPPKEGEDQTRVPYAHELLTAYGYSRGFMTSHGQPDEPRSARYILKDYVNGKLLYCEPPPSIDPVLFNTQLNVTLPSMESDVAGLVAKETDTPKFDQFFFKHGQGMVHSKGIHGTAGFTRKTGFSSHHSLLSTATNVQIEVDKPWKKHYNHKKKEKTRRIVGNQNPYDYY